MKTINILGKAIPVSVLAIVAMAGIASAGLLTYYGTITATVDVQQSIVLDGNPVIESVTFAAGSSVTCGDQHSML